MTEVGHCFTDPSSRLQLLELLNLCASHGTFSSFALVLAVHPLMSKLLLSMLLDNSPTLCTHNTSFFIKTIPHLAVRARTQLQEMLPTLLLVLARIICWENLFPANLLLDLHHYVADVTDAARDLELESSRRLHVRPELQWDRLESVFDAVTSPAPVPSAFFCVLYYLFPCNVITFLRNPFRYLNAKQVESPHIEAWEDAFDEDELRSKSEVAAHKKSLETSGSLYCVQNWENWSAFGSALAQGWCLREVRLQRISASGAKEDFEAES